MRTGQELQPITHHSLGVWYEKKVPGKEETFRFMLLDPAIRTFQDERHTANVVLVDGSTCRLAWRPSLVRRYPGWLRRQWEKVVGNPLLVGERSSRSLPFENPSAGDK